MVSVDVALNEENELVIAPDNVRALKKSVKEGDSFYFTCDIKNKYNIEIFIMLAHPMQIHYRKFVTRISRIGAYPFKYISENSRYIRKEFVKHHFYGTHSFLLENGEEFEIEVKALQYSED